MNSFVGDLVKNTPGNFNFTLIKTIPIMVSKSKFNRLSIT